MSMLVGRKQIRRRGAAIFFVCVGVSFF
jgi:hypothetical protein